MFVAAVLILWATPALSAGEHACDHLTKDDVKMVLGVDIGEVKS